MVIVPILNGYHNTPSEGWEVRFDNWHHASRTARQAGFHFDLIEPERPKLDAAILKFVDEQAFSASDLVIQKGGVCRPTLQWTRAVAQKEGVS